MNRTMKRIIYFIFAAMLLISCGGDKNEGGGTTEPTPGPGTGPEPEVTLASLICREWHSTSLPVDADIYLAFTDDKKFELYQQIGEGAYRLYRGTWNVEEDILMGKYNDGESWAASYTVAVDGNKMTLTSKNDAAEVSKYEAKSIPENVKSGCEVVVKSIEAGF